MATTAAPIIRAPARQQAPLQGLAAGSGAALPDEQPRSRGRRAARRSRRLRRHRQRRAQLGVLPRHRSRARAAGQRRDAARPVRQAGRRLSHARHGAARPHRQLQPGRQMGQLGALPRARPQGPDDVRPDDRRKLDLHRHAGHPAGHVPDLRRARRAALRRGQLAQGQAGSHRRHGRHGRRAAAFRHAERRRGPGHRRRPQPHRAPRRHALLRHASPRTSTRRSTLCEAARREGRALSVGLVGNCADVLPEIVRRGVAGRRGDRPDQRPRSAERLHPAGTLARSGRGAAPARSRGIRAPLDRVDGRARERDARPAARRRGHLRLRQQHPPLRLRRRLRRRLPHPRLRARVHSPALLHRARDRSAGSRSRAIPKTSTAPTSWPSSSSPTTKSSPAGCGSRAAASPSRDCPRASAGSATASARTWARPSTTWCAKAKSPRPSPSAATTSTPARSPAPIARPKRCSTAPMPLPTGRSSTRCSTPPPAPAGSASITAAAWAWATRSTPARSRWPTAPTMAARRIERVLNNDPGLGVARHADAGYELAQQTARERGIHIPMAEK